MEGNLRFIIDWPSLMVGSKFAVFALFYFVFEGSFPSTSSRGGLYLEGFFRYWFEGLIFWGAYKWRGLFSEFYGNPVYFPVSISFLATGEMTLSWVFRYHPFFPNELKPALSLFSLHYWEKLRLFNRYTEWPDASMIGCIIPICSTTGLVTINEYLKKKLNKIKEIR